MTVGLRLIALSSPSLPDFKGARAFSVISDAPEKLPKRSALYSRLPCLVRRISHGFAHASYDSTQGENALTYLVRGNLQTLNQLAASLKVRNTACIRV